MIYGWVLLAGITCYISVYSFGGDWDYLKMISMYVHHMRPHFTVADLDIVVFGRKTAITESTGIGAPPIEGAV